MHLMYTLGTALILLGSIGISHADIWNEGTGGIISSSSGTKIGIGISSPASTLDVNGAASISSTLGVGGSARFYSNVGIAGGATPDVAFYINPATSITSGATYQRGILSQITFPSSATGLGASGEFRLGTGASSFTMVSGIGLRVASPALGAGSAVTNLYGLKVENQSGGGTNYAIHTGAGQVSFGDAVSVSSTLGVAGLLTANGGFYLNGGSSGDGRMWKSGLSGVAIRGVPGSSYNFGLESAGGNVLLVNPISTSRIDILGGDGLRVANNLAVSGGPSSEFRYGNDFRMIDYRSISLSVGTEAWVKLATISNNSNIDFLFRNGSHNSEEVAELKVIGTYHVPRTGVELTRQTYNRHLKEVRITGTDGGSKTVYILVRTTNFAPTIAWAARVTRGSISTIHNVEETPTGGLSVSVDNSAGTVREIVGNLNYSMNSLTAGAAASNAQNLLVNGYMEVSNSGGNSAEIELTSTGGTGSPKQWRILSLGSLQSAIGAAGNLAFRNQTDATNPLILTAAGGAAFSGSVTIGGPSITSSAALSVKAVQVWETDHDNTLELMGSVVNNPTLRFKPNASAASVWISAPIGGGMQFGVDEDDNPNSRSGKTPIAITAGANVALATNTGGQVIVGSFIANPTPGVKLNVEGDARVSGTMIAQTIKTTTWSIAPDYVFEKDYKLSSLDHVERYVDEHKHLPDIPSAKEFKEKGMDLAEMNMMLLKKVEELTLYAIEQNKDIATLKKSIAGLEKGN